MQIAKTILQQLGGNKFIAMTGSKNFLAMENGIRMNLVPNRSGAKWLKIKLNAMDTYDIEFFSVKRGTSDIVIKAKFKGIYCDQLQQIFTQVTGLYTRL